MKRLFSRLSTLAMAAVAGGACLLGLSTPVQGQFGQAVGIQEMMRPEFINRDMVIFVEGRDLDDEQQAIIESMLKNYRDDFQSGLERLRQRFQDLRGELDTRDPDRVLKLVFAPFEEWRQERSQLRDRFLNNVQLVLSERQLSQWDSFLRKLRRDKTMGRGVLSGEHLNLFHVLRDIQISEQQRAAIEPVLIEYELALDEALRRRNKAINDRDGAMLEAMQMQDSEAMLQAVHRQVDLRVAVRNINDHYTNVIAEALPEELGRQFREKAMLRGYSRIFRRSSAEKLFDAVYDLKLDEQTKQRVDEVYASYRRSMDEINQRLLEMVRVHEPKNARQQAEAAAARMENKPYSRHPNPTAVEFRKRDEMVREQVDKLRWALGEERFAELPGADRWIRSVPEEKSPQQRRRQNSGSGGTDSRSSIGAGAGNRGIGAGPSGPSKGGGGQVPDE